MAEFVDCEFEEPVYLTIEITVRKSNFVQFARSDDIDSNDSCEWQFSLNYTERCVELKNCLLPKRVELPSILGQ